MTTNHDESRDQVLQHVDERRRSFLGRLLAGGAALAAVPTMTTIALGDDEAVPAAKGKGGKGKGGRGGPVEDTETIAARMIREFDKDGDSALNQEELAEAIKAAHERARQAHGKGGGKGGGAAGGKGKGGGTAGGGKGKGGGAGGGKGKGGGAAGGKGKGGGAGGGKGKGRRG